MLLALPEEDHYVHKILGSGTYLLLLCWPNGLPNACQIKCEHLHLRCQFRLGKLSTNDCIFATQNGMILRLEPTARIRNDFDRSRPRGVIEVS